MADTLYVWPCRIAGLLAALALLVICPTTAQARRDHSVYFQDTQHELNVYKIYGRKEGPTMMIIGGIQGDEPGGFLSADLYTDFALKQGNLIVVPRANFYSILLYTRAPNGDMNRKFGDKTKRDPDYKIVEILKKLMAESDILLNLHDGWGYYRPTYVSKMANPKRYGQSIIADCAVYVSPETGEKINLKEMAEKAIKNINEQIDNPKYHFHFMNTRTAEKASPYKEQRKSATYYAMTRLGIPAFGVETSKNLPTIEMKVHQHNLAINAFMEMFGLVPEQPRIYLEKPKLEYLIVSINNQVPVAVADGQALMLNRGDSIEIIHVESNYDRGLSVDILGMGTINDYRQQFTMKKPTFIVAQKDHIKFGRVPVVLTDKKTASMASVKPRESKPAAAAVDKPKEFRVKSFIIEIEGKKHTVPPGQKIRAKNGDRIKIVDIDSEGVEPPGIVVNFKGFVGDKGANTGEDRGYTIKSDKDLLARYSLSKKEKIYDIAVEQGKKVLAKITIHLK